jgi:hypothetical protein
MALIKRIPKGSALTHLEMDNNLDFLHDHSNLFNREELDAHSQYSLTSHVYSMSDISGTGAYSVTSHSHSMSDISGTGDYSLSGHLHDDRYYTETEIDTTFLGYSLTSHEHTQYALSAYTQYLSGGLSSNRPISPRDYEIYCDVTINKQI